MILLLYVALGAVAGLIAGLFGVGGGLVIVPALVFCFSWLGLAPDIMTQMAVGTSLATIVFTSLSSILAHHRFGNVDWALWRRLAPAIVVGVVIGVHVAAGMAGSLLQLLFGMFAVAVAVQMGLNLKPLATRTPPGLVGSSVAGLLIGSVSALFGIGGGTLTVPFLSWCNVRMQIAVGVSAACGLPIALVGLLTNVWVGWGHQSLPEFSAGFVYLPALLGIVPSSMLFARLGAKLAQRLPAARLKLVFALFLGVVGTQFILRNL